MGLISNDPIRGGDVWACVTANGRGQPVKIKRVTPTSVQFRPFGRDAEEKTHSLAIDLFRVRYAPLSSTGERQRAIRHEEKRNGGPILVEREKPPIVPPEPTPIVVTQDAPAEPESPKKRRTKRHNLTPENIREIYDLMESAPGIASERGAYRREVAESYGVFPQTVNDIELGRTYAWVTGANRKKKETEEPTVPPTQTPAPPITPMNMYQQPAPQESGPAIQIVNDMADALELLLEYAGRPIPKYIKIDTDAINRLVVRAREITQ